MSTLQFYLADEDGNHQYVIDPVEEFDDTETHWVIDNGYGNYEVEKAKYANCKAYIRMTPTDDNPLWRMKKHLEETGSTVEIDWN